MVGSVTNIRICGLILIVLIAIRSIKLGLLVNIPLYFQFHAMAGLMGNVRRCQRETFIIEKPNLIARFLIK